MGKDFTLSRKKEARLSMLLARKSGRVSATDSIYRDSWEKENSYAKRAETAKATLTTEASKVGSTDKAGDGTEYRVKEHNNYYSFGKQIRESEALNRASGRSAKELGIEWISAECSAKHTPPHSHHWIGVTDVDGGTMFRCKYCHRLIWLPNSCYDGDKLRTLFIRMSANEAYQQFMNLFPVAKRLLAKYQDLYLLESTLSVDDYAKVVAAISMYKEEL